MKKNLTLTLITALLGYLSSYGQSISYTGGNTMTLTVNTAITSNTPTVTGNNAKRFRIKPALPPGLSFDRKSGTISGTPTTGSPSTTYLLSCKADDGKKTAPLKIVVNNPVVLADYKPSVRRFLVDTLDAAKAMRPSSVISGAVYTISPSLPDGLKINEETGEITGTPFVTAKAANYTVTATDVKTQAATTYLVNITVSPRSDEIITPATVSFVGEGNIQQSLNTRQKLSANTGIGVVFRQASNKRFGILHDIEVDFSINVASTVDTLKSINNASNEVTNKQDFGNSVLLPLNSGQAFSFGFKGYLTQKGGENGNYRRNQVSKPLGGVLSGFNISLAGSNRNWEYNDQDKDIAPVPVKTSLLSFYAGPFYEFYIPNAKSGFSRNVSITLGVGYSARWILGDIQQGSHSDQMVKLLGTNRNSFNGAEIQLGLRFYNIKAEVHLPFFSNRDGVPGLTGTHLTTFIGFSGGFPIDLTKPSSGS